MASGRERGVITPMRQAAQAALPEMRGIFLRCDRGEALYVTNAPQRMAAAIDWESVGFHARVERGLCFLTPRDEWIERFCAWAQTAQDEEAERLSRAAQDEDIHQEDRALWLAGVKLLEMGADGMHLMLYEKRARQRAAVCMREKRGGGALRAAALCIAMMKGEVEK